VFGDIIRFDNPKIIQWYDLIVASPPKLYNALNSHVTAALQKYFADPPIIDEEEPFGALMIFQRHVVWRLVLQFPQINKALVLIESGPIQSAADVIKLRGANVCKLGSQFTQVCSGLLSANYFDIY
jgi:hypothetical protein